MAKTPAKRRASKNRRKLSAVRPVKLNAKQTAAAQKCLERSGRVRLGFKEVTLTKLPTSIAPILSFVD